MSWLKRLFGGDPVSGGRPANFEFQLDYDEAISLDAENLAEQGIVEAYNSLLPKLQAYVPQPAPIEAIADNDVPSYSVRFAGKQFDVYAPSLDDAEGQSWGRAMYAFFTIVNNQLADVGSEYRFFAINGGNDLFGIFLTCVSFLPNSLPLSFCSGYLLGARLNCTNLMLRLACGLLAALIGPIALAMATVAKGHQGGEALICIAISLIPCREKIRRIRFVGNWLVFLKMPNFSCCNIARFRGSWCSD